MVPIWVLAISVALSLSPALVSRPASAQPSCQANSTPTILHIDPPSTEPWSYVTVYGCNLHGQFHFQCNVRFNGTPGWVVSEVCSDLMYVAVPIAATNGPVTVEIQGVSTAPFVYEILPLSVGSDDIIPGLISVGILAEAEPNAIIEQMGGTIDDVTYFFCSSWRCWYVIRVPVGHEVQKAIEYYSNPNVVWASPEPVPVPALGVGPAIPSQDQPVKELPSTGARRASGTQNAETFAAAALLVAVLPAYFVGKVIRSRRWHE